MQKIKFSGSTGTNRDAWICAPIFRFTYILKWQFAVSHKSESRGQQTGEGQDYEHSGSYFRVDLSIGNAGNGKTDNDKSQIHERQIRRYAYYCCAIRFYSATCGKEKGIYGADYTY